MNRMLTRSAMAWLATLALAGVVLVLTLKVSPDRDLLRGSGGPMIAQADSAVPEAGVEAVERADAPPAPPMLGPPAIAAPLLMLDDAVWEGNAQTIPADAAERPVARISSPPPELGTTPMLRFPASQGWESDAVIGFEIHSALRYGGPDHEAILTVASPSPGARARGYRFGDLETRAPDGSTRWLLSDYPDRLPHAVVTQQGEWLVTLASDLPVEVLESLADRVVVEPSGGGQALPAPSR